MNIMVYLIKENKITQDWIAHYLDFDNKSQYVNVRINPKWCHNKCITAKQGVIEHVENKMLDFKEWAFIK